ncbi:hypothetical protein GPNCGGLF_LOCUS3054 [Methylorubrum aminovorans]
MGSTLQERRGNGSRGFAPRSLVIGETDRLDHDLAALRRVDKIEALRVALVNALRLSEKTTVREVALYRPKADGVAERDTTPLGP